MALAAGAGTGIQFAPVTREQRSSSRSGARWRCGATRAPWRRLQRARWRPTSAGRGRPGATPRCSASSSPSAAARPDAMRRVGPGRPEPLGVTLGRRRRQRRRLLGARHGDRALPVRRRRARPSASASRCPGAPATSSTASSPASPPAIATACARTAPYDAAPRPPLQSRPSSSSTRTRRALDRPFALHPSMFGARRGRHATRDDTDSAPFVPKGIATGRRAPAPRHRRAARAVERHGPLRAARARLHADASRRARARCAAPARASRTPRRSRT